MSDTFSQSDLDEFVRGYIEVALWSETDRSDDNGGAPLDDSYGPDDIDASALVEIRADCHDFLEANSADVLAYIDELGPWVGSDTVRGADARYSGLERCGGDFLLTRNHHGVGFWDRGLPDDLGQRLTDTAHAYGETYFYIGDDGKVYV